MNIKWSIIISVAFFVLMVCSSISTNTDSTYDLLPFSSKARFEPLPDDIDLPDVPEDVPDIHKQKCKINDPNSCSKYPNTVCEHFDSDVKVHFSIDTSKSITIKNEDPNEGYCMSVHHLSSRCNVFHGYWTLIKKTNKDNSYMKVCTCYRPGFIGNLQLFDACETPFICNGKVVDINTEFKFIECICKKEEENTFITSADGKEFPTCIPKKIKSVMNWNSILIPPEFKNNLIDADKYYPKDIASNIGPLDKLIDPCSICPVTGQQTGASATHAFEKSTTVFCITKKLDWGIPFRRSPDYRLLQGDFGPDGVLALKWDKIIVEDSGINTQKFTYIISPCNENKKFYDTLNIEYKQFAINVGDNNFLGVTILPKSSFIPRLFGYTDRYRSMIRSSSIAHAAPTKNSTDRFYVNQNDGNLISVVAIGNPSLMTNQAFSWSTAPLYEKKYDERFHYLTYKDQFLNAPIRTKVNVKGFCIRPLTAQQIRDSHWDHHKDDSSSYFIDLLISA